MLFSTNKVFPSDHIISISHCCLHPFYWISSLFLVVYDPSTFVNVYTLMGLFDNIFWYELKILCDNFIGITFQKKAQYPCKRLISLLAVNMFKNKNQIFSIACFTYSIIIEICCDWESYWIALHREYMRIVIEICIVKSRKSALNV